MVRQPKWVIDEVILAMDTYLQIGSVNDINPKNPLVVDLQRTLRSLPIHEGHKSEDKFRNLNGITMILLNIASLDENAQYSLRHAAKLQYLVWDYYKNKKDYLNAVARAIRYCLPLPFKYCVNTDIDQLDFMQGTILYQYHRFIELETKEAKERRKEAIESGHSSCAICGFNFNAFYGQRGLGYTEVHHGVDVCDYYNGMPFVKSDFMVVCSNCHRIIHRHPEYFSKLTAHKLLT